MHVPRRRRLVALSLRLLYSDVAGVWRQQCVRLLALLDLFILYGKREEKGVKQDKKKECQPWVLALAPTPNIVGYRASIKKTLQAQDRVTFFMPDRQNKGQISGG